MIRGEIKTKHHTSDGKEWSHPDEAMEHQRKLDYAQALSDKVINICHTTFTARSVLECAPEVYEILGRYLSEVHQCQLEKTV